MSMSGGLWSYNRFEQFEKQLAEKKAAKDYDGDGKVESSKDEYFGSRDKAIKKAMGKSTKKESKDDCECKEETELEENRFAAHGGKDTDAGAAYAKPSKGGSKKGVYPIKGKDGKPLFKEENIDEGSCGSTGYQKGGMVKGYQKGGEVKGKKIVKEDVLNYIIDNKLASNIVSAEVIFEHISDEFLDSIEKRIMEGFKPFPKEKVARQADKAYDKEQAAARAGNEKEVNKQMQRRIAMNSPASRRTGLQNKKMG